MDILSLAALFQFINVTFAGKGNHRKLDGRDLISIGQIYQKLGKFELSSQYYKYGLGKNNSIHSTLLTQRNYGLLNKRLGDWSEAIKSWIKAGELGDYISCIELAKYYEHKKRSYAQAKDWTEKALKILKINSLDDDKSRLRDRITHRMKRINGKLNQNE